MPIHIHIYLYTHSHIITQAHTHVHTGVLSSLKCAQVLPQELITFFIHNLSWLLWCFAMLDEYVIEAVKKNRPVIIHTLDQQGTTERLRAFQTQQTMAITATWEATSAGDKTRYNSSFGHEMA